MMGTVNVDFMTCERACVRARARKDQTRCIPRRFLAPTSKLQHRTCNLERYPRARSWRTYKCRKSSRASIGSYACRESTRRWTTCQDRKFQTSTTINRTMVTLAKKSTRKRTLDGRATAGNVFHGVIVVSGVFKGRRSFGDNFCWTITCATEETYTVACSATAFVDNGVVAHAEGGAAN